MEPTLGDMFLAIVPMLLLLAAWYFFMRKFSGPGSIQERQVALSERQVVALERIAAALEKRG